MGLHVWMEVMESTSVSVQRAIRVQLVLKVGQNLDCYDAVSIDLGYIVLLLSICLSVRAKLNL